MIQVVNRALDILEYVAKERDKEYTLGKIADNLGLNHATCANIIKTLTTREYIEKVGRTRGYRLGTKAYYLTGNYSNKKELLYAAVDPMGELTQKLNEGSILGILRENKRILLHEERSNQELQVINKKEKDVYRTSTGRVILACMEDREINSFIKKYGLPEKDAWPEVEDKDDLLYELKRIKKKQIAVQISKASIVGIGVPLFLGEKVIGSLGIYLPETRFNPKASTHIFNELNKTAKLIMKNMNKKNNL